MGGEAIRFAAVVDAQDRATLCSVLERSEGWLIRRILDYAAASEYTRYTSTLAEAWRQSIVGLTETIRHEVDRHDRVPELGPDLDLVDDPGAAFGVTEARHHRERGVNLGMFIGLMKYYRQAYADVITLHAGEFHDADAVGVYVRRVFDRTELAYCAEWAGTDAERQIKALSEATRLQTNEKNRYLTVFESLPSPALLIGPDRVVQTMNWAAARIFLDAATPGSLRYGTDRTVPELPWLEDVLTAAEGRRRIERRIEVRGSERTFVVRVEGMLDVSGKFGGFVVLMDDVTERRLNEIALRQADEIIRSTTDGVVVTTTDGTIIAINAAFTRITGFAEEDALGRTPRILRSGRHDLAFYQGMWRALGEGGRWQGEIWNRRRDGTLYPEWLSITSIRDPDGEVTHYVGVFSDLTPVKARDRLHHMAHHDALTGLPNRSLLRDRLEQAIARATRGDGQVAVLFFDLDGFKAVNDSLGHEAGDRVLREVAARARRVLRASDTLARVGGDEFVAVLEGVATPAVAQEAAEGIRAAVAVPLSIDGVRFDLRASIGIAMHPHDGHDADALVVAADLAMYAAKRGGRNRAVPYHPELGRSMAGDEMGVLLRGALERGEITREYQPQVRLAGGRVSAVECFARWRSPRLGPVGPGAFMPLAERLGLAPAIGRAVIEGACRDMAGWRADGVPVPVVAVNLGSAEIAHPDFAALVARAVSQAGIPAATLRIEVPEYLLRAREHPVDAAIRAVAAGGCPVSVDGCGAPGVDLLRLSDLPVSQIKLDTMAVRGDERGARLLRAVAGVARALSLDVVATRVEDELILRGVRAAGFDAAQGFLLASPLPEAALRDALAADGTPRTAAARAAEPVPAG